MYELYKEALVQAAYNKSRRPPSVRSDAVWRAMQAVQKGRLTEVSSTEAFLDASQPDSMTSGDCVAVFNRQAVLDKGAIWGCRDQQGYYVRAGEPLAWFHPADPGFMRFSAQGMVPLDRVGELVFLPAADVRAAEDMLKQPLGQGSTFVSESTAISRSYTSALQGQSSASDFETLRDAATILQYPRLRAFADKTAGMMLRGQAYPRKPYTRPAVGPGL